MTAILLARSDGAPAEHPVAQWGFREDALTGASYGQTPGYLVYKSTTCRSMSGSLQNLCQRALVLVARITRPLRRRAGLNVSFRITLLSAAETSAACSFTSAFDGMWSSTMQ